MKNNYLLLAEVLKRKRIKLGLSQRELGRLSGVSHTEVFRIENGERLEYNLTILLKLCNILGINIIELLIATGYISKNYMEILKDTVEIPRNFASVEESSKEKKKCTNCPFEELLNDILIVVDIEEVANEE